MFLKVLWLIFKSDEAAMIPSTRIKLTVWLKILIFFYMFISIQLANKICILR